MSKEEYKSEIIRIISETENLVFITSIYSFIKGILSVEKGGAAR